MKRLLIFTMVATLLATSVGCQNCRNWWQRMRGVDEVYMPPVTDCPPAIQSYTPDCGPCGSGTPQYMVPGSGLEQIQPGMMRAPGTSGQPGPAGNSG